MIATLPVFKAERIDRKKPRIIAMTCAKGESVRLWRKNLCLFAGKPLVEWTMIQHECSRLIDRNYLVTENEEVAELGERHGFTVVWESKEDQEGVGTLGGPNTVVRLYEEIKNCIPKDTLLVTTLPSSPNRYPYDIDNAILRYYKEAAKSESPVPVTVSPCVYYPSCAITEPGEGGRYFFNNTGFVMSAGGFGVNPLMIAVKGARWVIANCGQHDHHMDMMAAYGVVPRNVYYYLKLWQWHDIDNKEQFELCEKLFEAYIGGERSYKEYKEELDG